MEKGVLFLLQKDPHCCFQCAVWSHLCRVNRDIYTLGMNENGVSVGVTRSVSVTETGYIDSMSVSEREVVSSLKGSIKSMSMIVQGLHHRTYVRRLHVCKISSSLQPEACSLQPEA